METFLFFFGKEKLDNPNPKDVYSEECDNCGAIYILDRYPEFPGFSDYVARKARLVTKNKRPSVAEKNSSGLNFDVYDDGDAVSSN